MRLAVVSHKVCWSSERGYLTDGGFPKQIGAISELFDETRVVVPCAGDGGESGTSPLCGRNIAVAPLSVPKGSGLRRKLAIPAWFLRNARSIWREIRDADAVHAPIPGDVGTVGMLFALIQRKPLFVRHCGNWLVQRTAAERFWRWSMERLAGGRNVMFATGGADERPSKRNGSIRWIFSTSLTKRDIESSVPKELPPNGRIRLIIACRQEKRKGTDIVISALPRILERFPNARLDIVGGGSLLSSLRKQARDLGVLGSVTFHGKLPQAEVVDLMRNSHLFCFPTSASEGFPKVVIEAMASGLPVITTRVSVLPKLIAEGGGVLLRRGTADELAEAVVSLCSNPAGYQTVSAAALAAAGEYTLENWRNFIGESLREAWGVESLSSQPETRKVETVA